MKNQNSKLMLLKKSIANRFTQVIPSSFARIALLALLLGGLNSNVYADDTDIYTGVNITQCSTSDARTRYIFMVDNASQMTDENFVKAKATIDEAIETLFAKNIPGLKVAIMQYSTWTPLNTGWQYASNLATWRPNRDFEHRYDVTVPYTDDVTVATNWQRKYGNGSTFNIGSHIPGSLAEARIDGVYAPGGDLYTGDATDVQIVLFSNAMGSGGIFAPPFIRGGFMYQPCCNHLASFSSGFGTSPSYDWFRGNAMSNFGEYNELKDGSLLINDNGDGVKAEFTVVHGQPRVFGVMALTSGSIASVGGLYEAVPYEPNEDDPQGYEENPRRVILRAYEESDLLSKLLLILEQDIAEAKATAFTQSAPAVTVNAFNRIVNRGELYYSFFSPKLSPRWDGNLKRYSIGADAVIRDKNGNEAIDPDTGSIVPNARSYWSEGGYLECTSSAGEQKLNGCTESADGYQAAVGGFRDGLTEERVIYTQADATDASIFADETKDYYGSGILQIEESSLLDPKLLGLLVASPEPVNELELAFTHTGGSSFLYVDNNPSENMLIYNDSPNSPTNAYTAKANSMLFGADLGASLSQTYQINFSYQSAGGEGLNGLDNIIVGIQTGSDADFDDQRQITFGVEFQSNGKIRTHFNGPLRRESLDDYSPGDQFSVKVDTSTEGGIAATLLRNGTIFQSVSNLQSQTGVTLSAGDDFRAVTLGLESDLTGADNVAVALASFEIAQDNISSWERQGDLSREQLLSWILGTDIHNDNVFANTGDGNQFVADSLHSQPFLVTYGGTESDPTDIVFHSSNLGALHAVDPSSGTEQWAYIPPELLDNPRVYLYNDYTASGHTYGLDGEMSYWLVRADSDTSPSRVFLYTGQRRGGKGIYAFNATNAAKGMDGFSLPADANHCGEIGDGEAADPICQLFPPIIGGTDSKSTPGFEMLGQTWGKPNRIVVNTSDSAFCGEEAVCQRDVLLFAGGYDPQYDGVSVACEGDTVSSGVVPIENLEGCVVGSHLYMVDAFTGELVWSIGSVDPGRTGDIFIECSDSTGDDSDRNTCNDRMGHSFVGTPSSLDLDQDGAIDTLFASDISGQIWRIDLRTNPDDSNNPTRLLEYATGGIIADLSRDGSAHKNRFFYTSVDASILLGSNIHDAGSSDNALSRINLTIGSGNRAKPRHDAPLGGNRFFAVFDTNLHYPPSDYSYVATSGTTNTINLSDLDVLDEENTGIDFAGLEYGFQLPLVNSGTEKILNSTVTVDGFVLGVSYSHEFGPGCGIGGSKAYAIDLFNGVSLNRDLKQFGNVPTPVVLTLLDDGGTEDNPEDDEVGRLACFGTECIKPDCDGFSETPVPGCEPADDLLGKAKRRAWWEIFSNY